MLLHIEQNVTKYIYLVTFFFEDYLFFKMYKYNGFTINSRKTISYL